MASCHDMTKGEVYVCEDCGLELPVVKECKTWELPQTNVVVTLLRGPAHLAVAVRNWSRSNLSH